MILTKLGQHVNDMMAVAVKKIQNFATNAILHCGLTYSGQYVAHQRI